MRVRASSRLLALVAVPLWACGRPAAEPRRAPPARDAAHVAPPPAPAPAVASARASSDPGVPAPPPAERGPLTLVAGGDVELARAVGKKLLADPAFDPFATLAPLLGRGDVRFVNLEGPLSDQKGETMSPTNSLVFCGPPQGAPALARAGITIVSTANNHAWDYGRAGALETLAHLDAAGVLHVGTGASRDAAVRPVIVERRGLRLAFLAATDIWNQGPLERHEAREHVARADPGELTAAIAKLRADPTVDAIAVSVHGGDEYQDAPTTRTRAVLRAAIDAGADVVLGHHPHVPQGIEWRRQRPILYSMGNLLMQMHRDHPSTGLGYIAMIGFVRGGPPTLAVCPYRILGLEARPLLGDPARKPLEALFFSHLRRLDALVGGSAQVGPPGDDGCAPVTAAP